MNKKRPLSNCFKHIHVIFLFNHILNKLIMLVALLAAYSCSKAIILWRYPTVFFHKYERGLFACLGFYILLQVLKTPPTMKGTLNFLDHLLGHNRASTYWQFKEDQSQVAHFLSEEVTKVASKTLKPCHQYMTLPYAFILMALVCLIGMVLFNNMPSASRPVLQESIDYNKDIVNKIEAIEVSLEATEESIEETEASKSDLDKKLDDLNKDLLEDLKKTYDKDESLLTLTLYDKKKQGLLDQVSASMDQLPASDQVMLEEEINSFKEDDLREKVVDALNNREEQETVTERDEGKSLQDSLTELMSQSEKNPPPSSSDTLEVASETTGGLMEDNKDGQGGSANAYKGQAETIEEGQVHREETETGLLNSNEQTLQLSGQSEEERHLVYGGDIEADDHEILLITGPKDQTQIKINDLRIDLPRGIPHNRLNLLQAYYEGVNNE